METAHSAQAKRFRSQAKSRLFDRGESITALARKLGRARNTVSIAINRYRFRKVIAEIKAALDL